MAVNLKNVDVIQTMLKKSAYTWMCGIKEKLPEYLREFIQSEYYDAYAPSAFYDRQYRILEAIMTSEIRDLGNGYEFEIYLDAAKVSSDMVFQNMAKGIPGLPESGRFWERFLKEIGEGGIYDIFVGFKSYLGKKCHLTIK